MKTMEQTRQSSSTNKRAGFVNYGEDGRTFKYRRLHKIKHRIEEIKLNIKRWLNKFIQKPRLWLADVDWIEVRRDSISWVLEAAIEGFTLNFATHFIFGAEFSIFTMLAYGFIVKHGLSIWWRMRRDGSNNELLKRKPSEQNQD
jgi:hypothetical protein